MLTRQDFNSNGNIRTLSKMLRNEFLAGVPGTFLCRFHISSMLAREDFNPNGNIRTYSNTLRNKFLACVPDAFLCLFHISSMLTRQDFNPNGNIRTFSKRCGMNSSLVYLTHFFAYSISRPC